MTGYGRGTAAAAGVKVEVELSSLNRKQFDVRVSLPRTLFSLEAPITAMLHEKLCRGCVTAVVKTKITALGRRRGIVVDEGAAAAWIRALRKTARRLKLADNFAGSSLLNLPEVLRYDDVGEEPQRVWRPLARALRAALRQLIAMKQREGAALQKDLERRLLMLRGIVREIKKLAPHVTRNYIAALRERLKALGISAEERDPQLLKEIVIFADRSDISEETVRLESHLQQAAKLLQDREPVGRALDFICQEMFREINTIGSKANDAQIAGLVVKFKTELESIREQVQNVE